jgi:acetylornithine deacetylase/succinyl-diaminopimelate desuccinylase-like protein
MPSPPSSPVAGAVRTSARVALWTSLALTAATAWLLARYSRPIPPPGFAKAGQAQALYAGIDFLDFPDVRLLQRYVQTDTSEPHPDEIAGAEFLAAQLAAAGIPSTIERFADRRANLWAFVEGEDPRAVVLLGHLDVEAASETRGWQYPPFGGVVFGPWIYGRGMYDMKSLTIAQLLAMIDAAGAGRKPKRSLLFLQTSSEEAGSATGTRWILAEHPELVARMDTVLAEGGVVEATSPTDVKYWGVEFAQMRFASAIYCAPDAATLHRLAKRLRDPGALDPPPDVDPAIKAFLAAYGPSRTDPWLGKLLLDPERLPRERDLFDTATPFLKALLRDEIWPLEIEANPEGGYSMHVSMHLLPHSDFETTRRRLAPEWKTAGIAATPFVLENGFGESPLDHPDFRTLTDAVRDRYAGVPTGPYFLPWAATDSRYLRERGIRAYGFSPFPVVVFDTLQMGKANERMQLPAYRAGIALYRETVRRLTN